MGGLFSGVPPILPSVMASSTMELQLWVFRFLPTTHVETKRKQNAPTIFACLAAFHTFLSSRSDRSTYAPDKSWLFKMAGKTRIPLIGAPWLDKDDAGSGISGLYLWSNYRGRSIVCCYLATAKKYAAAYF